MRRLVLGIAVAVTSLLPALGMADDQQIADFIKNRLQTEQQNGNLRGFNVDMRVDRGTVWFKGHVADSEQEMLILRTAQQAGHLGVVQVVDDIETKQAAASVMEQAPFRTADYQQAPMQQDVYQQTSRQEYIPASQPMGNSNRAVSGGQPLAFANSGGPGGPAGGAGQAQMPAYTGGPAPMPASYGSAAMPAEVPNLPGYAWPGYASHPNYGAVTYPKQYSPSAWPYIGPFYPYPQVPLGWRKVTLEWDDGWWMLDFNDK